MIIVSYILVRRRGLASCRRGFVSCRRGVVPCRRGVVSCRRGLVSCRRGLVSRPTLLVLLAPPLAEQPKDVLCRLLLSTASGVGNVTRTQNAAVRFGVRCSSASPSSLILGSLPSWMCSWDTVRRGTDGRRGTYETRRRGMWQAAWLGGY
jgi:hypothetical protein